MSTVLKYLFVFLLSSACTNAANLPSFITPCKRSANDLDDCATKEANKILQQVLEGDKLLKLPSFKPFHLPEVKLDVGNNLKVKLTDIVISGLENNEAKKVHLDMENKHFTINLLLPYINLESNYDISGRILVLPIVGKGPANITFVGGDFTYDVDFDVETRKGKEYLTFKNPTLDFTVTRSYYFLENLFNGDKRLGEEMNKFLYENWKEVGRDLHPAITEVISAIATSLAKGYFGQIPLDEVLPKN